MLLRYMRYLPDCYNYHHVRQLAMEELDPCSLMDAVLLYIKATVLPLLPLLCLVLPFLPFLIHGMEMSCKIWTWIVSVTFNTGFFIHFKRCFWYDLSTCSCVLYTCLVCCSCSLIDCTLSSPLHARSLNHCRYCTAVSGNCI